jgi:hypothetical protein
MAMWTYIPELTDNASIEIDEKATPQVHRQLNVQCSDRLVTSILNLE